MIKSKVAVNKLFNLVRLDVKSIMKNCTFLSQGWQMCLLP